MIYDTINLTKLKKSSIFDDTYCQICHHIDTFDENCAFKLFLLGLIQNFRKTHKF